MVKDFNGKQLFPGDVVTVVIEDPTSPNAELNGEVGTFISQENDGRAWVIMNGGHPWTMFDDDYLVLPGFQLVLVPSKMHREEVADGG